MTTVRVKTIRIKAVEKDGIVHVRSLMTHPMETGLRKGADGKNIPAHHITEVIGEANGNVVIRAEFGPAVSRNPYLSFQFSGAVKGDQLKLTWHDNEGNTASTEAKIR